MKALLLTEYNHLEYTNFEDPKPGPQDVLIEVRTCGICESDIHGLDGSSGRRIPPLIMGHEAAGVIVSTGEQVTGWSVGDRVMAGGGVYWRFLRVGGRLFLVGAEVGISESMCVATQPRCLLNSKVKVESKGLRHHAHLAGQFAGPVVRKGPAVQ